jgi:hypothetical protein
MADWKDFEEDNRERAGQLMDSLLARLPPRKSEPAPPPAERCPVCLNTFYSGDSLKDHITQVHGPQHVYLRVNGCIVREIGWAGRGIESISVVLLGHARARVRVSAGGSETELTTKSDASLNRGVPSGFEGELSVEVVPEGGSSRAFKIYVRSLPEFHQDDIDRTIWEFQDEFGRDARMPDLQEWRNRCGVRGSMSALEDRYVNGFYEYTLGYALEREGDTQNAKEHFEDAFGLLLPFRTVLAEQAQCVLGLKMNCFGALIRCEEDSVFGPSRAFFTRYPEENWKQPKKWPARDSFGLYMDDFTKRLARQLAVFYGEDDDGFWKGVEALRFHPASREKNNADKLQVMEARAFARTGDRAEAKKHYGLLRYHPYFGAEAEEFLKHG